MDIVRRKLILVTIGTKGLIVFKCQSFMYLIEGLGLVHEKMEVWTGPNFFSFLLNCNFQTLYLSLCFEFYYSVQKRNKHQNNVYFSQVEHSRITFYIHILTFTSYVFENKDYSKLRRCSQKLYIDKLWKQVFIFI